MLAQAITSFAEDMLKRDVLTCLKHSMEQEDMISTENVVLAYSAEQLMLALLELLVGSEQKVCDIS